MKLKTEVTCGGVVVVAESLLDESSVAVADGCPCDTELFSVACAHTIHEHDDTHRPEVQLSLAKSGDRPDLKRGLRYWAMRFRLCVGHWCCKAGLEAP